MGKLTDGTVAHDPRDQHLHAEDAPSEVKVERRAACQQILEDPPSCAGASSPTDSMRLRLELPLLRLGCCHSGQRDADSGNLVR